MLLALFAGTLSILLTHLLLVALLIGAGLLVRRSFGLTEITIRDLLVAFWVGIAGAILLLLVWTYFWRVNAGPLLLVGLAGIGGLAWSRRSLRGVIAREPWCHTAAVPLLLIASSLWVANLGRGPLTNWDSALYHVQGVMWAREYPTVPGLANLFGGLAFNNASLLYAAMLDVGPWAGRSHHIANGLLIQVLVWQGLLGVVRVVRSSGTDRVQGFFEGVLLAPAVHLPLQDRLPSYVTDLPMAAVILVAASQLHLLLLNPDDDRRESAYRGFTVLTLLAVAVTFKLPAAPLAATSALLVAAWLLLRIRLQPPLRGRAVVWTSVTVGALAAAWLGRGALLSGYLLFPSSGFALPVEWRAPEALARGEYAFAAHSSFSTADIRSAILGEMGFLEWLPLWWSRSGSLNPHYLTIPIGLLLLATGLWLVLRTTGRLRERAAATWWLVVPAAIAGLVWFRVAPEPRYGAPFFWILAAVVATATFAGVAHDGRRFVMRAAALLLLLGLSPTVVEPLYATYGPWRPPLTRLIQDNLLLPGPSAWLHPMPERPKLTSYTTTSGLVLHVPERHCWNAPLPCTRNPAPNLRLRVAGNLGSGFVIDGPWAMEDWPAPNRKLFREAWAEHERRRTVTARP